jgi:hypothetical protein
MGAASAFQRASREEREYRRAVLLAGLTSMLDRELRISGAVQVDTCIVTGAEVLQDGTVELQVVRKDARDG